MHTSTVCSLLAGTGRLHTMAQELLSLPTDPALRVLEGYGGLLGFQRDHSGKNNSQLPSFCFIPTGVSQIARPSFQPLSLQYDSYPAR